MIPVKIDDRRGRWKKGTSDERVNYTEPGYIVIVGAQNTAPTGYQWGILGVACQDDDGTNRGLGIY